MGYHVSIIRTMHGKNSPLSQDEVMKAAARVPGWQYDLESSDATFFDNGEEVVTLWFDDGELWAKNPSDKAIDAMIQLATALNGRVRGDEGETYENADKTYRHPEDEKLGDNRPTYYWKDILSWTPPFLAILIFIYAVGKFLFRYLSRTF